MTEISDFWDPRVHSRAGTSSGPGRCLGAAYTNWTEVSICLNWIFTQSWSLLIYSWLQWIEHIQHRYIHCRLRVYCVRQRPV